MPLSLLQRHVLGEFLRILLLGFAVITGILVLLMAVEVSVAKGLGSDQIVAMIPYLAIMTLPFTAPSSLLLAVTVVYGRLTRESALTALKAGGAPITHVIWPVLAMGALLSGVIYGLQLSLIPTAHLHVRLLAENDVERTFLENLRRYGRFEHPSVGYAIAVRSVQGGRLLEPTLTSRDKNGVVYSTVSAREAEIHVDADRNVVEFHLLRGEALQGDGVLIEFESETLVRQLPVFTPSWRLRALELTSEQLLTEVAEQVRVREQARQELVANHGDARPAPALNAAGTAEDRYDRATKVIRLFNSEYARRKAQSAAALCFVLIGCPIGIWFHCGGYLDAFAVCLPLLIGYFTLILVTRALGRGGRIDPFYGMWLGDVILGLTGLILLWRLTRH